MKVFLAFAEYVTTDLGNWMDFLSAHKTRIGAEHALDEYEQGNSNHHILTRNYDLNDEDSENAYRRVIMHVDLMDDPTPSCTCGETAVVFIPDLDEYLCDHKYDGFKLGAGHDVSVDVVSLRKEDYV